MRPRDRMKSNLIIILSMILGFVCFTLARLFLAEAMAQGTIKAFVLTEYFMGVEIAAIYGKS